MFQKYTSPPCKKSHKPSRNQSLLLIIAQPGSKGWGKKE